MNRRRLERLAEFLETLKPKRGDTFDMAKFGHQRECGTVACALGWAALSPKFRGLEGEWNNYGELEITHNAYSFFAAGAEYFGVSDDTSNPLFSDTEYDIATITQKTVARRVRQLLKLGEDGLTKRLAA